MSTHSLNHDSSREMMVDDVSPDKLDLSPAPLFRVSSIIPEKHAQKIADRLAENSPIVGGFEEFSDHLSVGDYETSLLDP